MGNGTPLKYDNFMAPYKGNTAFSLNPKLEEYKKKYFDHYAKDIMVSCPFHKGGQERKPSCRNKKI